MTGRMETLPLNVTTDQARRLRGLSMRTRVPMSSYLREAVELVLERHEQDPSFEDAGQTAESQQT